MWLCSNHVLSTAESSFWSSPNAWRWSPNCLFIASKTFRCWSWASKDVSSWLCTFSKVFFSVSFSVCRCYRKTEIWIIRKLCKYLSCMQRCISFKLHNVNKAFAQQNWWPNNSRKITFDESLSSPFISFCWALSLRTRTSSSLSLISDSSSSIRLFRFLSSDNALKSQLPRN